MSSSTGELKEFDGWSALSHAVHFLYIHLVIMLLLALIFWIAMLLTNERSAWPLGKLAKLHFAFLEFSYVLAFSVFGGATAFFLSLGLKRGETGESVNGLIENFAAPFISLLTAGLVFATSRSAAGTEKSARTAICVACFLFSVALSYRTFFYQILTAF